MIAFPRNVPSRKNDVKFVLDAYEEPPEEHPVRPKYSVHVRTLLLVNSLVLLSARFLIFNIVYIKRDD